jgi:hypothetical protein
LDVSLGRGGVEHRDPITNLGFEIGQRLDGHRVRQLRAPTIELGKRMNEPRRRRRRAYSGISHTIST